MFFQSLLLKSQMSTPPYTSYNAPLKFVRKDTCERIYGSIQKSTGRSRPRQGFHNKYCKGSP
jgi:hypothetical protein